MNMFTSLLSGNKNLHFFKKVLKISKFYNFSLDKNSNIVYTVLAHRGDKGKLPNTKQTISNHTRKDR